LWIEILFFTPYLVPCYPCGTQTGCYILEPYVFRYIVRFLLSHSHWERKQKFADLSVLLQVTGVVRGVTNSYLLLWVPYTGASLAALTEFKGRIADTSSRALEFPDLTVQEVILAT
jgi:hypothetical protein